MNRSTIMRAEARRLLLVDCYLSTVKLLLVDNHVHRGTKIWYISNDNLKSSISFIRNDCRFVVSFNKLDDRLNQTVFLVVVCKILYLDLRFRMLPHESLQEPSNEKRVNSMPRSIILRADARRLLYC